MGVKTVRRTLADGTIKEYVYGNEKTSPSGLRRAIRARPGLIYFIQAESGPIKVGFTLDLPRRFNNLQAASHEQLTVVAVFAADAALEKRLKRLFRPDLIRGEWYRPSARVLGEIRALSKELKQPRNVAAAAVEARLERAARFMSA